MEPLTVLASRKRKSITRLSKASKIYKSIIKAIQDKKGEQIIVLDLRKIPEAVSDFFVICQATSTTQVKAIAENVEEKVKKETGEIPYRHEGKQMLHWEIGRAHV